MYFNIPDSCENNVSETNFEIYMKKANCNKKTPNWIENDMSFDLFPEMPNQLKEKPCLIKKFFDEQRKLPINQRKNYCLISCNCPRCSVWC